ncbi:MAG TPA: magnesium-translocating P-type ATPase [Candidatus Dormibacteraeota bacterium]|nr:magnesium-translocating P-type ATPase [Candidatus Dormibacteraeota bacterium]
MQLVDLREAARIEPGEVLRRLETTTDGLSGVEASARLRRFGPNEIERRGTRAWEILWRQFQNPFLILLVGTALLSLWLHYRSDATIILAIVLLSVGLSFLNEYSAEKAVADLRARVSRTAVVVRDGKPRNVRVAELVVGDVVRLAIGDIVPADLRLVAVNHLECDESALTGEPYAAEKSPVPIGDDDTALAFACCAYFGTIVKNGAGSGVVVATGSAATLGSIAHKLSNRPPETAFERGLRDFSMLLVWVTVVLAVTIFAGNTLLHHAWLASVLFALSIAIGMTPQLLPAIVTLSLSFGARRLAQQSVLVKRLVSIEDLGNVQVLFTDKTGTLTEGKISFRQAIDADGTASEALAVLALVCTDVVFDDGRVLGGNALDVALWEAASAERRAAAAAYRVIDKAAFSYERQMMCVLVDAPDGSRLLIAKGAPEAIAARAGSAGARLDDIVNREMDAGSRTVVLASSTAAGLPTIDAAQARELAPLGVLTFADEPKAGAAASLERLRKLDVSVKIVTGDSDRTAQVVCRDLNIAVTGVLTGKDLASMSDAQLTDALDRTTIFARVTPDQKSRIIKLQRATGCDVGFLGDGINDAVALHDADVGISVDSAADVAKDAADIVLLEKDLGILADGVIEGRRIFANTTKYVMMGTSSNFGNMFSAAGASLFLPFLPMLPSQILLNNLLYDVSEMTIPTDSVDEEQLRRPAHWDMTFIRRFMLAFGPISSIFDFVTFGVMYFVFHAGHELFRTGWFVESLATQSLIIFLIRTRRVPFFTSRPSWQLTLATAAIVAIGMLLPFTPLAPALGFVPLPPTFFAVLGLMILTYLALVEFMKRLFYGAPPTMAHK